MSDRNLRRSHQKDGPDSSSKKAQSPLLSPGTAGTSKIATSNKASGPSSPNLSIGYKSVIEAAQPIVILEAINDSWKQNFIVYKLTVNLLLTLSHTIFCKASPLTRTSAIEERGVF